MLHVLLSRVPSADIDVLHSLQAGVYQSWLVHMQDAAKGRFLPAGSLIMAMESMLMLLMWQLHALEDSAEAAPASEADALGEVRLFLISI